MPKVNGMTTAARTERLMARSSGSLDRTHWVNDCRGARTVRLATSVMVPRPPYRLSGSERAETEPSLTHRPSWRCVRTSSGST